MLEAAWPGIHLLARTSDDSQKSILYELVVLTDQMTSTRPSNWLKTHPLENDMDAFDWTYACRKALSTSSRRMASLNEFRTMYDRHCITKDVWGPYFWEWIHLLALSTSNLSLLSTFLPLLYSLIPCPQCREHAPQYLAEHPLTSDTNDAAFAWTVGFHNGVCERLNSTIGTRKPIWTVCQARQWYEKKQRTQK